MTRKQRTEDYRHYFWCRLKQYEEIVFKTTRPDGLGTYRTHKQHRTVKIVAVNKDSVKLMSNDEKVINVKFKNIISVNTFD